MRLLAFYQWMINMNIVPFDESFTPETGYYRIRKNNESYGFIEGELVYVYAGESAYHVFFGNNELIYSYNAECDEFNEHFEFVPDGLMIRQQQIAKLIGELSTIDFDMINTQKSISGFAPHVENGELSTSTALVPAGSSVDVVKKVVADVRNSTLKLKKDMESKTTLLKAWVGEQSRALEVKAKEMMRVVKKMEEAIWTINLYLGRDEQIHILRTGKPASEDKKISIRQSVCYMDEECAIDAAYGGIDVTTIEEFDRWLLEDSKNLNRVLPETKGIVALHIRRSEKKYSENRFENSHANHANLSWTYFLIRNGENLYRVYVDINTDSVLFPLKSEFDDLFTVVEEDLDDPTRPAIKRPLKPGSDKYMAALKRAEASRQYYFRIMLVLQGLMDRTPIFSPMPIERINLCDPRHCDQWIDFIYDVDNVVTDGKPLFYKWQNDINSQLDVGVRIIGAFAGAGLYGGKYESCRIYPTRASLPSSEMLHIIEDKEIDNGKEKYIFRYHRNDSIYSRERGYVDSTVRARCWVLNSDRFILNFDAATIEDMRYYIDHRLSRDEYQHMVPLLKIAIELKLKEASEEAPFRRMLVGQIMQRCGVSQTQAEDKIDELIKWWKFKNRTHRALLSDDVKATSMIIDEFKFRQKQSAVREQINSTQLQNAILAVVGAQTPPPVLIAHKSDNKYVAYVPHNDSNVWVIEQTWVHNRQTGDITMKDSKDWKVVDKRHERWEIIYKHDRWHTWEILPRMSEILTDPEIAHVVELGIDRVRDYQERTKLKRNNDRIRFIPLYVVRDGFNINLWYSSKKPHLPVSNIITNKYSYPEISRVCFKWKRTKDGVSQHLSDIRQYGLGDIIEHLNLLQHDESKCVIKMWEENVNTIRCEYDIVKDHIQLIDELSDRCYDVITDLIQTVRSQKIIDARVKFDADYGDPELWDDYFKSLKIDNQYLFNSHAFRGLLYQFVERSIDIDGWTVQQVYDKALEMKLIKEIDKDIPTNYVIKLKQ